MLDAQKVEAILRDCLYKEDEIVEKGKAPEGSIIVNGLVNNYALNPWMVDAHKEEIRALLAELPDNFRIEKGGGWTFLNACMDRDGNQWGEHINIEQLLVLGIAAKLAKYSLPREMWSALPGSMPYFSVDVRQQVPAQTSP